MFFYYYVSSLPECRILVSLTQMIRIVSEMINKIDFITKISLKCHSM